MRRHPEITIADCLVGDARASVRAISGASRRSTAPTAKRSASRPPSAEPGGPIEVDYFHFEAPCPPLPLTLMPRDHGAAEPARPPVDLGLELDGEPLGEEDAPEPLDTSRHRARVRRRTKLFMSTCAVVLAAVAALTASVAHAERRGGPHAHGAASSSSAR
jgi:hypothetical protein